MTTTRSTVAKGSGALFMRRYTDDRLLFLNINSKMTFAKATTEGDKVQGYNLAGTLIDLDVAGSTEEYTLDVTSKKNTQNINEAVLDSSLVNKASIALPHAEVQTVTGTTVNLNGDDGGTIVSSTMVATFVDGSKLTAVTTGTPTTGQFKDNADGTVTVAAADIGKQIVFWYSVTRTSVQVQGGSDQTALGYLNVFFLQQVGTSDVTGRALIDHYWLPKCSLSGDASLEFSDQVQDKEFKLTALIPDTPSGWQKPYQVTRNIELNPTGVS